MSTNYRAGTTFLFLQRKKKKEKEIKEYSIVLNFVLRKGMSGACLIGVLTFPFVYMFGAS